MATWPLLNYDHIWAVLIGDLEFIHKSSFLIMETTWCLQLFPEQEYPYIVHPAEKKGLDIVKVSSQP